MSNDKRGLRELLDKLGGFNYVPGPIQVSKLGSTYYVNCEIADSFNIISECITCGMDKNLFAS